MGELRLDEELRRLADGPAEGDLPGDFEVVTYRYAAAEPAAVLERVRQVIRVVIEHAARLPAEPWPSLHGRTWLPDWFVRSFEVEPDTAPPRGPASRAVDGWTLDAWLSWFEPDAREWYWHRGEAYGGGGRIEVEVAGWPYPDGALRRLVISAGADAVEIEETEPSGEESEPADQL